MQFTAHNILLNNEITTMGPGKVLLAESRSWKAIKKSVEMFIPDYTMKVSHLRVVDLGCMEGGYAVEFARMGFDTLGIEIRKENITKCKFVKENTGLENLRFEQDDARDLVKYGTFDISFCSGLLYHLNNPVAYIKTLYDCTSRLLILNTHYAPEQDLRYRLGLFNRHFIAPLQNKFRFLENRKNYQLSTLVENEGYRGRWYREWRRNEKREVVEGLVRASYQNYRSFWLCKTDLVNALTDAGFRHVFEQFDYTGDLFPERAGEFYSRGMFIALK